VLQDSSSETRDAPESASNTNRHVPLSSFQQHAHECAACAIIFSAASLSSNSEAAGEQQDSPTLEDIESAGEFAAMVSVCV
jgi:hypothetical protein